MLILLISIADIAAQTLSLMRKVILSDSALPTEALHIPVDYRQTTRVHQLYFSSIPSPTTTAGWYSFISQPVMGSGNLLKSLTPLAIISDPAFN